MDLVRGAVKCFQDGEFYSDLFGYMQELIYAMKTGLIDIFPHLFTDSSALTSDALMNDIISYCGKKCRHLFSYMLKY